MSTVIYLKMGMKKLNKLDTSKIKDLKLQIGIIKKQPNKAEDTVAEYVIT